MVTRASRLDAATMFVCHDRCNRNVAGLLESLLHCESCEADMLRHYLLAMQFFGTASGSYNTD